MTNKLDNSYLLIGNYGNFNIGDETLLKQIVGSELAKKSDGTIFYVPVRNPQFVGIYHKELKDFLKPIDIKDFSNLVKTFSKCNHMIIGGGGIWSKYTGKFAHFIPIMAILGKICGKHVEFISVGIYSTASIVDRVLVNLAISIASSCSVRDNESYKMLWNICRTKTKVVDDLSLPLLRNYNTMDTTSTNIPKIQEYYTIEKELRKGRHVIGISLKPMLSKATNSRVVEELSKAINSLNAEYQDKIYYVLFPFAKTESEIENDSSILNDLRLRVTDTNNMIEVNHANPLAWFVAIKEMVHLFIGMRYHSIIFANQACKPVLSIPYEKKIHEYVNSNHNTPNCPISVIDPLEISSVDIIRFVRSNIE